MADDEYPVDYIRVAFLVFAETNVLMHFSKLHLSHG